MEKATAFNVLAPATPILRVADLRAAIEYYTERLGFKLNWDHSSGFASIGREHCNLFLCQGDQGHAGSWLYVGVGDVGPMEAEFAAKGARIRQTATNFPWAREMQVEDLDGNVLRFGSEPLKSEPFGEFLGMEGRLGPVSSS